MDFNKYKIEYKQNLSGKVCLILISKEKKLFRFL